MVAQPLALGRVLEIEHQQGDLAEDLEILERAAAAPAESNLAWGREALV